MDMVPSIFSHVRDHLDECYTIDITVSASHTSACVSANRQRSITPDSPLNYGTFLVNVNSLPDF